jgi:hypothetical protein
VYHLLHPQNAAPIATVGAPAAAAYLAAKCSCPSSVAQPWDASLFTANQPPRGPPTDPLVTPRLALPPPPPSTPPPSQTKASPPVLPPAGAALSGLDSASGGTPRSSCSARPACGLLPSCVYLHLPTPPLTRLLLHSLLRRLLPSGNRRQGRGPRAPATSNPAGALAAPSPPANAAGLAGRCRGERRCRHHWIGRGD